MKKIIVFVLMAAIITGIVFAQSLPGMTGQGWVGADGGFQSPQSMATLGRLRSSADDFIRPDAYQGVRFENSFAFVSYALGNRATLGYATKFGSLYLGLFYGGSLWANAQMTGSTEERTLWHGSMEDNVKTLNAITFANANNPYNQVAVLFGIADMGIRLSFITTYKTINDSDFVFGGNQYKSLELGNGNIVPQLAWSMTKNLTEKGIRPWATFEFGFYNDFSKNQLYNPANGDDGARSVAHSNNYMMPELQVGLGGFTIANVNSWRTSIDLEYRMRLQLWENEFVYNNEIKKIKGRNGATFDEYSHSQHRIRPIISTQWNGDKLRLRGKLDLNIEFRTTDITPMYVKGDGSLGIGNGLGGTVNATNALNFRLNPDLALAAQWQMASKISLNMGGRINVDALQITSTTGKRYIDDVEVANSSNKTIAYAAGAVSSQLSLGVTINATDNLFIEAVCGGGIGNTGTGNLLNNNFDIFSTTNGPFSFASILVGLRF